MYSNLSHPLRQELYRCGREMKYHGSIDDSGKSCMKLSGPFGYEQLAHRTPETEETPSFQLTIIHILLAHGSNELASEHRRDDLQLLEEASTV